MNDRHVYVDFATVRIQQYLSRTSDLRGHRAASNSLAYATSAAAVGKVADGLAEVNEEAGEADGVVSLRFPAEPGTAHVDRVRRIQDRVFGHLRAALPGAEFQSVWGEGDSYLSVYADTLRRKERDGDVRHDLPANAEFPLAIPCRSCELAPAAGREPVHERMEWLCPDCSMRNVPRRQVREDPRSPEARLRADIGLDPAPDHFPDLAALGAPGSGGNHLATVAADGNAFGVFFKALADEGLRGPEPASLKQRFSVTMSRATREALAAAVLELPLTLKTGRLCVVPHVVGGDDVLVSMPADQAWPFTLHFLREFEQRVRRETAEVIDRINARRAGLPGTALLEPPTASAGIVFARHRHPLNLQVESAGRMLSEAKRAFRGRRASVQWLDITAEGSDPPDRPPLLLSTLQNADGTPTRAHAAVTTLVRVPAGHRNRLAEALRDAGPIKAAAIADRVGHLAAVRPFLAPFDRPGESPAAGVGLAAALGIARWWTCE
ncbi:hypothetical protein [Streptomyces sp. NBC_00102]|uniref:Cas10/Cmr2 second palm domain-containing protein n=1 Tax=Streptomyces sp. NBC_00102 TaxID=2975652 RepID=UPI002250B110|nr:hypothetical protein [Streptomyces sp. NBC_00102]MCX5400806.1 hypothetical protein [Streptomyces sp. NBC_00102]